MQNKETNRAKRIIMPSPLGDVRPCPIITDPQGCYAGKPIEVRKETI